MNQKGQALVEFIIILPIFILLICGALDLGNVIFKKYQLESDMDTVAKLYTQDKKEEMLNYTKNNEIELFYQEETTYTTITLYKKVNITTPFIKLILDDPYSIEIKRVVYHE